MLTNIGKCWGIWMFLLTIYCKWLHSSLTYPILSSLKLCYIRYIHAALYGIKNIFVVLVQLYFPLPIQSRRREKFSRRRRIFSSCIGSISSFFQNLITTSKEAPPISRDNRVINVLFGISVSIANGRRLIYLLRIMLRSFTHGSFRLLGDYNLDTFFFDGINLLFYALPIRDNTI